MLKVILTSSFISQELLAEFPDALLSLGNHSFCQHLDILGIKTAILRPALYAFTKKTHQASARLYHCPILSLAPVMNQGYMGATISFQLHTKWHLDSVACSLFADVSNVLDHFWTTGLIQISHPLFFLGSFNDDFLNC